MIRGVVGLLAAMAALYAADVVSDTQRALSSGDIPGAERAMRADRAARGVTPEGLEAESWIARVELASHKADAAEARAKDILALYAASLHGRAVDSDARLATAIGAAIEVRAQAMAARGERLPAAAFLRRELAAFRTTSIAPRLSKNLNLLMLEGHAAPALDVAHTLGEKAPTLAELRGHPVLLFFWAHWCADCKGDEPVIAKLAREFQARGLAVIAPTRLYGYTAEQDTASPEQELAWTKRVFDRFYSDIPGVRVPLGDDNFRVWGASTTPTIVVLDRAGIVRLYHPGAMSEEELRPVLERAAAGARRQ